MSISTHSATLLRNKALWEKYLFLTKSFCLNFLWPLLFWNLNLNEKYLQTKNAFVVATHHAFRCKFQNRSGHNFWHSCNSDNLQKLGKTKYHRLLENTLKHKNKIQGNRPLPLNYSYPLFVEMDKEIKTRNRLRFAI